MESCCTPCSSLTGLLQLCAPHHNLTAHQLSHSTPTIGQLPPWDHFIKAESSSELFQD